MKKLKATVLRSLLFLLLPLGAMAQGYSGYNWYFGNSTQAIRFSRSDNSPTLDNKTPMNTGGSAVASSQLNGDLLFYTDGVTIYDASNATIPGATGLPGDPAGNQPVVIAKRPGSDTKYYSINCL